MQPLKLRIFGFTYRYVKVLGIIDNFRVFWFPNVVDRKAVCGG